MPRLINHKARKVHILHHALNLFGTLGYNNTSIGAIADASNISRATLYRYFKDKKHLLFFAVKELTEGFLDDFEIIAQKEDINAIDRLKSIGHEILSSSLKLKKEIIKLAEFLLQLEREEKTIETIIKKRAMPLRRIFSTLIETGIKRGEFRPVEIEETVNLFISLLTASLVQMIIFHEDNSEKNLNSLYYFIETLQL